LQPGCPSSRQHPPRQLGLGGEADALGNVGLVPPLAISTPLLGEVKLAVEQAMSPGAAQGQKHPNLAVLNPAGCPAVLALDPHRVLALFQEARLIDNERSAFTLGQQVLLGVADELVSHGISAPLR